MDHTHLILEAELGLLKSAIYHGNCFHYGIEAQSNDLPFKEKN